jgi:hypothetical protein
MMHSKADEFIQAVRAAFPKTIRGEKPYHSETRAPDNPEDVALVAYYFQRHIAGKWQVAALTIGASPREMAQNDPAELAKAKIARSVDAALRDTDFFPVMQAA